MFPFPWLTALPLALASFVGGDGPTVDGPQPPAAKKPAAKSSKRSDAAKVDPLAEAARLKRSATGKEGEEKITALTAAATEYERVAKTAVATPALGAEATWRAGEIWRTVRHEEDARRCFAATTSLATAAPNFAARAWLELGHLDRRAKRLDDAEKCYAQVLIITPEQRRESAQAMTWQGKILIDQKNEKDGHALLLAVGQRYPELRLDDIRNVDLVAVDWIEAGRINEARELVADCIERHSTPDEGDDEVDTAVRRALDRMRSREKLANPPATKG